MIGVSAVRPVIDRLMQGSFCFSLPLQICACKPITRDRKATGGSRRCELTVADVIERMDHASSRLECVETTAHLRKQEY